MLENLHCKIERMQEENHKIILLLDANEKRSATKKRTFGWMAENLDMKTLLNNAHT